LNFFPIGPEKYKHQCNPGLTAAGKFVSWDNFLAESVLFLWQRFSIQNRLENSKIQVNRLADNRLKTRHRLKVEKMLTRYMYYYNYCIGN